MTLHVDNLELLGKLDHSWVKATKLPEEVLACQDDLFLRDSLVHLGAVKHDVAVAEESLDERHIVGSPTDTLDSDQLLNLCWHRQDPLRQTFVVDWNWAYIVLDTIPSNGKDCTAIPQLTRDDGHLNLTNLDLIWGNNANHTNSVFVLCLETFWCWLLRSVVVELDQGTIEG